MIFDSSAMSAQCRFCGTKYLLSREDTDFFHDYYSTITDLITPDKDKAARKKKAEKLWEKADTEKFVCKDGTEIEINYMHRHMTDGVEVFTARRSIAFLFSESERYKAEKFRKNVSMLDYPSADTKHLSNFFPNIIGGFDLNNGGRLLVISKDEDEYPLRLFSGLDGRHAAWIISRMENLCCVLEFSGLVHSALGIDTLYINPYLHQANLYGGWWMAGRQNSFSADRKMILTDKTDLSALRTAAANVLGFVSRKDVSSCDSIPQALKDFIVEEPYGDAYDDFGYWDKMLIKAYGERKFIDFNTDDEKVYGGE